MKDVSYLKYNILGNPNYRRRPKNCVYFGKEGTRKVEVLRE